MYLGSCQQGSCDGDETGEYGADLLGSLGAASRPKWSRIDQGILWYFQLGIYYNWNILYILLTRSSD